jgi:hypothetical protein
MPHASCIGSHKVEIERPSTIGRRGPRRRVPRDVRLHADGEAGAQRDAGEAGRRPAPVRLLGGYAAATPAQRRRPRRAEEIFLTHYHADHYLGLPGMLKTFALRGREVPLTIYGPKGPTSCSARCGGSSVG